MRQNTFIPAVDAPANNAGISLSYSLVDQVTAITQSGSTTSFTYDALGRRVNETVGSLTTVRHYSDTSDNPEWTIQQSGANLTTEIYTGSLGEGLAVTTTFKGAVRTSSLQLTDVRGNTVTTLDLDTNSVGAWSVYDSFGNPQTSQTNTNLINYSSYGQQERATNTTGLVLMGARVYNPETNQFTSKDPIPRGNENTYTYPNDPINGSDFSGCWGWDETFMVLSIAVMFVPVAGEVAMAVQSARLLSLAFKTCSLAAKAESLILRVRFQQISIFKNFKPRTTEEIAELAGDKWTKFSERQYWQDGKRYSINYKNRRYRTPSTKSYDKTGQRYANFERGGPRNGHKNDYKHNTHVIIKDLR